MAVVIIYNGTLNGVSNVLLNGIWNNTLYYITDVGSMLAIETVLSFGTNGTYNSSKPAF